MNGKIKYLLQSMLITEVNDFFLAHCTSLSNADRKIIFILIRMMKPIKIPSLCVLIKYWGKIVPNFLPNSEHFPRKKWLLIIFFKVPCPLMVLRNFLKET